MEQFYEVPAPQGENPSAAGPTIVPCSGIHGKEYSYLYASGKLLRETITGSGAIKDLWLSV